jgi:hypothetical protein
VRDLARDAIFLSPEPKTLDAWRPKLRQALRSFTRRSVPASPVRDRFLKVPFQKSTLSARGEGSEKQAGRWFLFQRSSTSDALTMGVMLSAGRYTSFSDYSSYLSLARSRRSNKAADSEG